MQAFVDEYGDTSIAIEKDGVTAFYIVTAVLVADDQIHSERLRAERIRKRFFPAGEMKSSSVGTNDRRRIAILQDLSELGIRTYTLAVDKRELDRASGLAYHRSFFKFLSKRLYERIFALFDDVQLVADEHGRSSFMKGFEAYVDRELPLKLWGRRDFSFENSRNEVMLQVADVISGSLARVIDPAKKSPLAPEIRDLVAKRSVGIVVWPPQVMPDPQQLLDESPEARRDGVIRAHCIRQAKLFTAKHGDGTPPDDDINVQLKVLEMLIFAVEFGDEREYVPSQRIVDRLRIDSGITVGERKLRSVISNLRDAGVVIGTSQRGYKIPISEADVAEFVCHANAIVPPMLGRLQHARSDILAASLGEIDILSPETFSVLRRMIDALPDGLSV